MATIHEMELIAGQIPDIGLSDNDFNMMEVTDMNDDFGMDLLANNRYLNKDAGIRAPQNRSNSYNVSSFDGGLEEIDIQHVEPIQEIKLDFSDPPSFPSVSVQRESSSYSSAPTYNSPSANTPASYDMRNSYGNTQTNTMNQNISLQPAVQTISQEEEIKKKAEIINKLNRLEAKGLPMSKRFTMDNTLQEVQGEYDRLVDAKNLETSIRFQRNTMMSIVSGLEYINNKFDPFDVKLEGWSESVHENVEDFDDVFEELYDKYKDRGKMPPEARLMFMLAGSGFMCHMSNSFFRSKMPSAEDVFKKNPELAKQFVAAAATEAGSGFGNFIGMTVGAKDLSSGPAPNAAPQGFFGGSQMPMMPQHEAARPAPQVARREMRGPSGVDDILRTVEEITRIEAQATGNFVPPSMISPPMPQDIQSVHSGDMSYMTERTSATGRRGGKRRQAPVGNVMDLDV